MNNKKLLGKRIKELRKTKGLTQEQLAEIINLETCSLSAIESGRHFPSLPTIEKIAITLNHDLKSLFDFQHLKSKQEKIEEIKNLIDIQNENVINIIYRLIKF